MNIQPGQIPMLTMLTRQFQNLDKSNDANIYGDTDRRKNSLRSHRDLIEISLFDEISVRSHLKIEISLYMFEILTEISFEK